MVCEWNDNAPWNREVVFNIGHVFSNVFVIRLCQAGLRILWNEFQLQSLFINTLFYWKQITGEKERNTHTRATPFREALLYLNFNVNIKFITKPSSLNRALLLPSSSFTTLTNQSLFWWHDTSQYVSSSKDRPDKGLIYDYDTISPTRPSQGKQPKQTTEI